MQRGQPPEAESSFLRRPLSDSRINARSSPTDCELSGDQSRHCQSFPDHRTEEPFVLSKGGEEMIRKVYELDPLLCPSFGGPMKIIAFIEDPVTIDNIIRHLKLSS
jgi:hypothetical protein